MARAVEDDDAVSDQDRPALTRWTGRHWCHQLVDVLVVLAIAPWALDIHRNLPVVEQILQLIALPRGRAFLAHCGKPSVELKRFTGLLAVEHILTRCRIDDRTTIGIEVIQELVHRVVKVFARKANARGIGVVDNPLRHREHFVPSCRRNALLTRGFDNIAVDIKRLGRERMRIAPGRALNRDSVQNTILIDHILRNFSGHDQSVVGQLTQCARAHVGNGGWITRCGQRQRLVLTCAPWHRLKVHRHAVMIGFKLIHNGLIGFAHFATAHDEMQLCRVAIGQNGASRAGQKGRAQCQC